MSDVLTLEQRRLNMSRIRAKDTKPEMILRRGLHARGLRYRLHQRNLPGRPDLVFSSQRAVVFVHGCFWHGHDCHLFVLPATRREFWEAKIGGNRKRDIRCLEMLRTKQWRVLTVWECALRGRDKHPLPSLLRRIEVFIKGHKPKLEVAGGVPKQAERELRPKSHSTAARVSGRQARP